MSGKCVFLPVYLVLSLKKGLCTADWDQKFVSTCSSFCQVLLLLQHGKTQAFGFFQFDSLNARTKYSWNYYFSNCTNTFFGDYHQESPNTLYMYSPITDISKSGEVRGCRLGSPGTLEEMSWSQCTREQRATAAGRPFSTPLVVSDYSLVQEERIKRKIQGQYYKITTLLSIPEFNFSSPNSIMKLSKEAVNSHSAASLSLKITGGKSVHFHRFNNRHEFTPKTLTHFPDSDERDWGRFWDCSQAGFHHTPGFIGLVCQKGAML